MVITNNLRPTRARRTMRIDQCLRIDLEMGFRRWVDVGGGTDFGDPLIPTQQQPTTFAGMGHPRLAEKLICNSSTEFQFRSP